MTTWQSIKTIGHLIVFLALAWLLYTFVPPFQAVAMASTSIRWTCEDLPALTLKDIRDPKNKNLRICKPYTPELPITPVVVAEKPPTKGEIIQYIFDEAGRQGMNGLKMLSLARTENVDLDPNLISADGGIGLFQLMPATAKEMGVNPYNWRQNVQGGIHYWKLHPESWRYNCGEHCSNPNNEISTKHAKRMKNHIANALKTLENLVQ